MKNPHTQVQPKFFNDKDILNNVLSYEKDNTSLYSTAMNEASNQQLYQTLFEIFTETQNMQRAIYNLMFKKGWYSLDIENKKNLTESYNEYAEYIKELQ
ncbi:spore coat protein [Mycoplasmatota bacterium WC44]